jgi:hypothetical protein
MKAKQSFAQDSSEAHMITSLESNGSRFDMFTGEERFGLPHEWWTPR